MLSPLDGWQPPYELASDIMYFHDWRYIHTGGYSWLGPDGKGVGLWTTEAPPPMRYEYTDMPLGLRLVAQPARKTPCVLSDRQANEPFLGGACVLGGCVLQEDGRHRLWYDAADVSQVGQPGMGHRNYIGYAESDNGMDWTFPKLGLVEREGSTDNSMVYGPPLFGDSGYHGGGVFRDDSAPPAERYKLVYLGTVTEEAFEAVRSQRPEALDGFARDGWKRLYGMFGAVSPDGLSWTRIPEPLVIQTSDTRNVCEYDAALGQYVAYCRTWHIYRRSIGRMATDDFRRFPLPEEVFCPDASMTPDQTWYANAKTTMPGASDHHIMFPLRWSLKEDRLDFFLATSPDNVVWSMTPGGPVCEPGESGAWDGACVTALSNMVTLGDDRIGMLVHGSPVPHKHPRSPFMGSGMGWAWWPKGRLIALRADDEGTFALWPVKARGRAVHLNFRTSNAGFVKVEVIGEGGGGADGRTFDDCDLLTGDHLDKEVSWAGQTDPGHPDGEAIVLRFRMRNAELYSVEFK